MTNSLIQKKNITVVGCGYVGMSLSVLFGQYNNISILEIDEKKIQQINNNESPINDKEISNYLKRKDITLQASNNQETSFSNADYIIVSTPTNFDEDLDSFNTDSVDSIIEKIVNCNKSALIIIKSTIPVGHTAKLRKKYNTDKIIFSPEFLREGSALLDNLYPSRIIIGDHSELAKGFGVFLKKHSLDPDTDLIFTNSSEAESIKLFSNAYLAMRVAFFNEIDSFAVSRNLNSYEIISGISSDSRIGNYYNNPSFGFGGYCLPKDIRQLQSEFKYIDHSLIGVITKSNQIRKEFIAKSVLANKPKTIGIYLLSMKKDSDNYRFSAILDVITYIKQESNVEIIIFEPAILSSSFMDCKVITDLDKFISSAEIILANRHTNELNGYDKKVFTRDLFGVN